MHPRPSLHHLDCVKVPGDATSQPSVEPLLENIHFVLVTVKSQPMGDVPWVQPELRSGSPAVSQH